MKIEIMDLNFMNTEQVVASFLLLGDDSVAIVETGPTTCLDRLTSGLKGHGVSHEDVRQVFLTHTTVNGSAVLRVAIGSPATTRAHVERLWALLRENHDWLATDFAAAAAEREAARAAAAAVLQGPAPS